MSIETALKVEIEEELTELSNLDLGSAEHKAGVDSVTKLMDKAIELDELELKLQEQEDRKRDYELKEKQAKDEKIDRIVKNVISAVGILVTAGITVWGTKTSLKFEETGSITTSIGRGFINKLLPKK
jgi:hypothetical protein